MIDLSPEVFEHVQPVEIRRFKKIENIFKLIK